VPRRFQTIVGAPRARRPMRAAGGGSQLLLFVSLSIVTALPMAVSKDAVARVLAVHPVQTSILDSSVNRNHLGIPTIGAHVHRVQMVAGSTHLISYFLESFPSNIDMSTVPKTAKEIVVAQVRIVGRPSYLVGRDQSGEPPSGPRPKNLFHSWLKILNVRSGAATVGAVVDATFGLPNSSGLRSYHPYTPKQLDRDYFVVMYIDDDGRRRLAGFAIEEKEYRLWESEIEEYDRLRR
jgi:hypothetical protein